MTESKKKTTSKKPKTTITVESKFGFKVEVDKSAFDDFEALELLGRVQTGDVFAVPPLLNKVLGAEQTAVALDKLRNKKTGRVSVKDGVEFTLELLSVDPNE